MWYVHVFVDESSHSPWAEWFSKPRGLQEHELEGDWKFIQYHSKLILEHSEEILNVKPLESSSPSWTRSVLSHDQAIKWTQAKVRVYSDSVLCVGQMKESEEAITRWEGQVEELPSYTELSMEKWIFVISYSSRDPKNLARKNIKPEMFTDRIIFMSMFNDIDWTQRGNDEICSSNAEKVKDYGSEKKWYQNGAPQPTKWYSDSKKPVISCSKASVLWVVESWKGRRSKKPCTSMEMYRTQNSCSELIILLLSSVFTEPWRCGVNNSAWQRKKRNESILTSVKSHEVQL